ECGPACREGSAIPNGEIAQVNVPPAKAQAIECAATLEGEIVCRVVEHVMDVGGFGRDVACGALKQALQMRSGLSKFTDGLPNSRQWIEVGAKRQRHAWPTLSVTKRDAHSCRATGARVQDVDLHCRALRLHALDGRSQLRIERVVDYQLMTGR